MDHPERIGPYRILEALGEGGMGTVYLAEQQEPIQRRVAVKVIKLGMDTEQVIARFDAERRALALMDHPNIARVLDAGKTDEGRPYFVMEHVPGVTITDYCDREQATTEERLDLFAKVCSALQHAHQKGVIHRDVKPGNVLVATLDGRPVPKVIDFGLARAMGRSLTEHTLHTRQDQIMGTPLYMSPEQIDQSPDIDSRADIYSLGAILYELLTGLLPYDKDELIEVGFDGMLRVLREEDPKKPSTRLAQLDDSAAIARLRRTEARRLVRDLRGDLDWIVMKAMEKPRGRRYDSASELAADIERFRTDQPVSAGPPSAVYRMRKFVRRNRTSVAAAAALFVALLAGMGTTSWQWVRAVDAEERAEAMADLEAGLRARAELAREEAEEINRFLTDMLASADPRRQGKDVKVADVLAEAAVRVRKEFDDKPGVRAAVLGTIGRTYRALGLLNEAEELLDETVRIRRSIPDEPVLSIADELNTLAVIARQKLDFEKAGVLYREAIGIYRAHRDEAPEDLAITTYNFARLLQDTDELEEAEAHYRESLDMHRDLWPDDDERLSIAISGLASILEAKDEDAEALVLCRESLERMRRAHPEPHPYVPVCLNRLANSLRQNDLLEEAAEASGEALAIARETLGNDHPHVGMYIRNRANILVELGRHDEAEPLVRESLENARAQDPWDTLGESVSELLAARLHVGRREYGEAEAILLRLAELDLPASDRRDVLVELVELYETLNRPEEVARWQAAMKD